MKRILFVCLGNICRSPGAEAIMNHLIEKAGIKKQFVCDSAGIIGYHAGEMADSRMRAHASRRGYKVTSISRQVIPSDFDRFDMIVGMDGQNILDLRSMVRSDEKLAKIVRMTDFCTRHQLNEVPDPYYGGADGFELVLDILEDACAGLLKKLQQR